MSHTVDEKGTISYPMNDLCVQHHHDCGSQSSAALPVRAYVHDTAPQPKVTIANAGPLGLLSSAATIFLLSMYNVHSRGVTIPNAVIGMACFFGGLGQFVAGMWDFASGNLFGASVFSCYGAFWMSYATFLHPSFGITDSYNHHPNQFSNATGIFLSPWLILTFIFLLASLRVNLVLILIFVFLDLTFLFLMIYEFTGNATTLRFGGLFGIITSVFACYLGAAQLLTEDNFWFNLPVVPTDWRSRRRD